MKLRTHTTPRGRRYLRPLLRYIIILFALLTLAPRDTCAKQTASTSDAPIALLKQGSEYYYGKNFREDRGKGESLVREAFNKGVEKMVEQAEQWFQKTADNGNTDAKELFPEQK